MDSYILCRSDIGCIDKPSGLLVKIRYKLWQPVKVDGRPNLSLVREFDGHGKPQKSADLVFCFVFLWHVTV
jgi:hypothetical protein